MNIMSLDLEMNQPSGTIIQVGVAIGNLESGEILDSEYFDIHVEEKISEYITKLTGITQKDVDNSFFDLDMVYRHLGLEHHYYDCFRNPLTWGGGDSNTLRQQLGLDTEKYLFGHRWIDAKTLFVSKMFANGLKAQSGLARSMTRLGMKFEGKKHNAMDDAVNTFRIYHKLIQDFKEII